MRALSHLAEARPARCQPEQFFDGPEEFGTSILVTSVTHGAAAINVTIQRRWAIQ